MFGYTFDPAKLKKVEDQVRELALRKSPKGEVTIRQLLPGDFGLSNWSHNFSAADTFENLVSSYTIPDNNYYAIIGVADPDSNLEEIKITVGASDKRLWSCYEIEAFNDKVKWLGDDEIIILGSGSQVTIQAKGKATGATEIVLIGVVGEPLGETIEKK